MPPTIRPATSRDVQPIVELSLRAWAPVFASIEQAFRGSGVFEQLHPDVPVPIVKYFKRL